MNTITTTTIIKCLFDYSIKFENIFQLCNHHNEKIFSSFCKTKQNENELDLFGYNKKEKRKKRRDLLKLFYLIGTIKHVHSCLSTQKIIFISRFSQIFALILFIAIEHKQRNERKALKQFVLVVVVHQKLRDSSKRKANKIDKISQVSCIVYYNFITSSYNQYFQYLIEFLTNKIKQLLYNKLVTFLFFLIYQRLKAQQNCNKLV